VTATGAAKTNKHGDDGNKGNCKRHKSRDG
jgi:hypothetical protein